MYVEIHYSSRLGRVLQYHSLKQERGQAEYLGGVNLIGIGGDPTRQDLLYQFGRLQERNFLTDQNTLHLSISFHAGALVGNEILFALGKEYMERMGFGELPFVMYRHNDSNVPHLHIVGSRIREDGSAIQLERKDFYQSSEIRKELEERWSLQPPGVLIDEAEWLRKPVRRVVMGDEPLAQQFGRVLHHVVDRYHYTNLEEFNAVLQPYNMEARATQPAFSRDRGLYYLLPDREAGQRARRISAHRLYDQPTLDKLERRFAEGLADADRPRQLLRVRTEIGRVFLQGETDWSGFGQRMAQEQIDVQTARDRVSGEERLYFIDHRNHAVFAEGWLGEGFDAAALQARCVPTEKLAQAPVQEMVQRIHHQLI